MNNAITEGVWVFILLVDSDIMQILSVSIFHMNCMQWRKVRFTSATRLDYICHMSPVLCSSLPIIFLRHLDILDMRSFSVLYCIVLYYEALY